MKVAPLVLLACLLMGGVGGAAAQQAEAKASNTLKPSDLGLYKWVFEAKAKPNETVVFRERTYQDDKLERTYELLINHPGETCSGSVLLLDHDFLAGENGSGNYSVKADSSGGILVRRPLHDAVLGTCYTSKDQSVVISFATNRKEIVHGEPQKLLKLEYDLRVENYEMLKKRIPELPPPDKGFFWYKQDPDPTR